MFKLRHFYPALVASALFLGRAGAAASDTTSPAAMERKSIAVLKSHALAQDKAVACKQLAIYGTKDAVPALAPLLADESLASWARIALEAIPGTAADKALRSALAELHGKLLIGVLNSVGVRRDPGAIGHLVTRLKDPDPDVASAAAVALGHIGGAKAGKALTSALAQATPGVRGAVAEGCILCAAGFLGEKKHAEAARLYDAVRAADVPKQQILEATRGAILARESAGIALLLEQLRSPDKALFGIGLRTARELPGQDVTETLAAELGRASADRQAFLLLALGDRRDAAVLPAVFAAARTGSPKLRLVAVGILDRRGDVSALPVLLEAAAAEEADLAQAALAALARLPGNEADTELLARLPQSAGKTRQALIRLAAQRHTSGALPAIVSSASDADAGVRIAAIQAMGALGDDQQVADLVRVLQSTQSPKEREAIEAALIALSGRSGAACVPHLLILERNEDSGVRAIGVRVLAGTGGSQALAAVEAAVADKDESVSDEAVRALSAWPGNWPEDTAVARPLLTLAKSGQKPSHQVLGLRGYLQYVQGDKQLKDSGKVDKIREVLPLMKRPEEKRLAIAVLGGVPAAGALELLLTFAKEPDTAEDACATLVKLAEKQGISKAQRQQALAWVVEQSKNTDTQSRAKELLKP